MESKGINKTTKQPNNKTTLLRGIFKHTLTKTLEKFLHVNSFFSNFAYKLCLTSDKQLYWIDTTELLTITETYSKKNYE